MQKKAKLAQIWLRWGLVHCEVLAEELLLVPRTPFVQLLLIR